MKSLKQQIVSSLQQLIKDIVGQEITPDLERPVDEKHGDYASNIALTLFGKISKGEKVSQPKADRPLDENASKGLKSPMELAENIAETFNSQLFLRPRAQDRKATLNFLDKVEVVKPGFINFWISKKYLSDKLQEIREKKEEYGKGKSSKGKKIMVEFTDPNPFKEFHIGHLYSDTVGESISRLLEAQGATVKRANYQGDVGMHVAKALYGLLQLCHAEFISASEIMKNKILKQVQDDILNKRIKFLGEAYAFGAKNYEEDEKAKKEIEELNKKIYDKDPAIIGLYEKGRQWSLEYFETVYKRLGTKFDFYYFESEVGKDGLELVKQYLKKGVFEESQGAVIFPGEKYDLHNRVFVNSLGLPTYEAKELGLALRKYKDFQYDQSVVITGNEIVGYFKVILAALGKINLDLAAKTKHLPHGMVRLPTGKMSSRTGNIITGEWLLDEAKKLLKSKYSEMNENTLEKVAVGSVKYALLKSSIGHDIEFDFEESINIQGNSGPYLQYTYARTRSVLANAKLKVENGKLKNTEKNSQFLLLNSQFEPEEVLLLRWLNRLPEVVEQAGRKFAPNLLCNYLFDLAQKFNLFYQKHKIIGSDNQGFRLSLTSATGIVLKNGLKLLGIQTPVKM